MADSDTEPVRRDVEFLLGDGEFVAKYVSKKVPRTDLDHPYRVGIKDKKEPKVMVINSPLIGALRPAGKAKDLLRNALRVAAFSEVDCVILTGNIIWMDILRASNLKPYRAQSSGVTPNTEALKYPTSVEQVGGSLKERQKESRVRFLTFKDRFDVIAAMLRESFYGGDGQPVFKGPILVSFGAIEEALSIWYTNEKMALEVEQERKRIDERIKELRKELKKATEDERENIEREIEELKAYKRVYINMTNIDEEFIAKTVRAMQGYILAKLEDVIPNSTVVATGDAYIKLDSKVLQVTHSQGNESVNGGLTGKLRRRTISRVKALEGKKLPDIILGAGLNPFVTGNFVSYRAARGRGDRDDVQTSIIIQLPTCIDSQRYREISATHVKAKDLLMRLAGNDDFDSGAVILTWASTIPRIEILKSSYLVNEEIMGSDEALQKNLAGNSILYFHKEGCTHEGARFKSYYPLKQAKNGRWFKSHFQVVFDILQKTRAPILGYFHDGDACQGYNYDVEKEVHPQWKSGEELVAAIRDIEAQALISVSERLARVSRMTQLNSLYEGILQPQDQWDSYIAALESSLQFFLDIIERARNVGLIVRGSQLAPITFIRGNHNENTFKEGRVSVDEARIIVRFLRGDLFAVASDEMKDYIKRYVACGRIGTLGEATGVLGVLPKELQNISEEEFLKRRNVYIYSLFMMHKQGTSKLADNMEPMRKAYNQRGTAESHEVSASFGINLAGDDHLGGFCVTRSAFHIKTGGQMFKNAFGDKHSFPMQNIFNACFGVPKDGPHTGPLIFIMFNYPEMRKWAWDEFPIDGAALFTHAYTGEQAESGSEAG